LEHKEEPDFVLILEVGAKARERFQLHLVRLSRSTLVAKARQPRPQQAASADLMAEATAPEKLTARTVVVEVAPQMFEPHNLFPAESSLAVVEVPLVVVVAPKTT
jgi:hypothetical protein